MMHFGVDSSPVGLQDNSTIITSGKVLLIP
jgi:hypothetical protein